MIIYSMVSFLFIQTYSTYSVLYVCRRNSLIETRGGLDNQRVIRDNLIDFCKRKSRDCSIDNTEHMSNVNGNSTSPHSTHLHQSPSKPSLPNVPVHWAHSER